MIRQHDPKSTGLSRRRLLKTAAAAGAVLGFPAIVRPASAKKFLKPIVAGLNAKEGDPSYNSIALIPKFLREKFDIEMEFQIHHSSTLGTDISQLEAVQTGFLDITSNATPQFSRFSKEFEFVGLPYAITDWDMGERLFKSELWKRQAAGFEKAVPVKVLPPVGAGGFRMLWNSKRMWTVSNSAPPARSCRSSSSRIGAAIRRPSLGRKHTTPLRPGWSTASTYSLSGPICSKCTRCWRMPPR